MPTVRQHQPACDGKKQILRVEAQTRSNSFQLPVAFRFFKKIDWHFNSSG